MGFAKIRMGEEEIFTTVVEDMDGRELEKWKVMKRDYPQVVRILIKKFGLNIKIIDKNRNNKDRDIDWVFKWIQRCL